MLKNSARNVKFPASPRKPSLVSFFTAKSNMFKPGPTKISRPTLPKCPADCNVKAHGSKNSVGVPSAVPGRMVPLVVVHPVEPPCVML